jgi:predicted Zn-dependent protease
MKKTSRFLCFLLILVAVACAINPVTGKRELMLISEQQEIELGKQTDAEIGQEYGLYNDPALANYVTSVGMALVPYTHRPNLVYHFAVLDSPVVNAFAAPGGYIYVTRGILALMSSEAELAGVLGHELGHVSARHTVRQMSTAILFQVGLVIGSALSEKFAKIAGIVGLAGQLLFLKFSRDDERQADSLGVQYSRKAQFNAGEMVSFFSSLQRYGDLSGGSSVPGFLSTHPLTSERIKNVSAMITPQDTAIPKKREPYLNRIENMIYGDDPRQGYVQGNAFYHPGMRFVFSFPQGWNVQNTPVQVSLAPEGAEAAMILRVETTNDDLAAFAQKKASSIEGRQFVSEQQITIHGMASYHQIYNIVQQDQEPLRVRLSFLRKGANIYYFTALSKEQQFGQYDNVFRNIVSSFDNLNDPNYLNRQPKRLKILKADGTQRLNDIFSRNGVNKNLWSLLAIANEMKAEDLPALNQLIKIVR